MGMNNTVYMGSRNEVEKAIQQLDERAKAVAYKSNVVYGKEITRAKESLTVLLGKLEYMAEKFPEKLTKTEVHVTEEEPKEGRISVMKGKYVKMTYNLFSHKESFHVYLHPISCI